MAGLAEAVEAALGRVGPAAQAALPVPDPEREASPVQVAVQQVEVPVEAPGLVGKEIPDLLVALVRELAQPEARVRERAPEVVQHPAPMARAQPAKQAQLATRAQKARAGKVPTPAPAWPTNSLNRLCRHPPAVALLAQPAPAVRPVPAVRAVRARAAAGVRVA